MPDPAPDHDAFIALDAFIKIAASGEPPPDLFEAFLALGEQILASGPPEALDAWLAIALAAKPTDESDYQGRPA